MKKCIICGKTAIFKIKGEEIYYCKEHAKKFFNIDSLEIISNRIKTNQEKAEILKKYLEK